MPKIKYQRKKRSSTFEGLHTMRVLENKYYGIFMNNFKFPELTEEENHFVLKRFWRDGKISAFILPESRVPDYVKIDEKAQNDLEIIFTPFAEAEWNIYDFPTYVSLIQLRGATFIPTGLQKVNEDVVIGYAHKTHSSIRDVVMWYVRRMCEIEMAIEMQIFNHKLPRLVGVNPEDRSRMEDLIERIDNGEKVLYVDSEDVQNLKNILDSGQFVIDKLYAYEKHIENELLTWLGFNNTGIEKTERLLVDEVNANNQTIINSGDNFIDSLQNFCDKVTNILGFKLTVESLSQRTSMIQTNGMKGEKEDDDTQL